jgi:lipoate-protein ligase A
VVGLFDRLGIYHDVERRSAALNMATDEALLESAAIPAIRFYGWAAPALSFGYFGKFDEAQKVGAGRDLVRRWTGGGIVLHGADLTYSIVIPANDVMYAKPVMSIYTSIHAALRDTFIESGHDAVLAVGGSDAGAAVSDRGYNKAGGDNGACFANPVRADVMMNGKKIAGAAQRRTRAGLLQQGSIQYENLAPDFAQRFARALCPSPQLRSFDSKITRRAREIAGQKYAQRTWLARR